MRRKTLLGLVALLLATLLALPLSARADEKGASPDNPLEVPEERLVIQNGTYYGISKEWFESINPNKSTMYFTVDVPSSVTTIASDGFRDSYSSDKDRAGAVTYNDGIGRYNIVGIDFSQATSLTTIKSQAAMNCQIDGALDLSKTQLTTIEKSAFSGCTDITGVILPDTLEVLGAEDGSSGSVFNGCSGLEFIRTSSSRVDTKFELPDGLRVIGKQTFRNTFPQGADLKIQIPDSVEIVESEAFYSNSCFSQICIERNDNLGGYDSGAFKAQATADCLLILPSSSAYNATNPFTRVTKTYPVTIKFIDGSSAIEQTKLYGLSIQYEQNPDNVFWTINSNYTLPAITGVEPKPGYDAGWQLNGDSKVLTNTSKVAGTKTETIIAEVTTDAVVASPDVKFTVNGVPATYNGTGVPSLEVELSEGSPGSVGVEVTHPLATEEAKNNGTYVYFKYCWWDEVDDGVNGPRSEEDPTLFSSSTSSAKLNRVFTNQASIPIRNSSDERTGGDYYLVEIYGYYVKDGSTAKQFYKSSHNFIASPDTATDSRAYVMNVSVKDLTPITITTADMTIYMGGNNGYDAVVGSGSAEGAESNSLPTPLFYVNLPQSHAAVDVEKDVTLAGSDNRMWSFKKAGTDADGVPLYYINPTGFEGQDPVRVTFKDDLGNLHISDEFDPAAIDSLFEEYEIAIYGGSAGNVTATIGSSTLQVTTKTGTLTVRAVEDSEDNPVIPVSATPSSPVDSGSAAIVATDNTTYTLNDTTVPVDTSGVGLLFDSIIDDDDHDRTAALIDAIEAKMNTSVDSECHQAQYLDLVDANNGNAWVKASQNVTVYWGYPEGTDKNTKFTLYHFEGLHRDGENSGFDLDDISAATVDGVNIETTDKGISFSVEPGGFSPFVLVWEKDSGDPVTPPATTHTITATAGKGGSISPSGRVSVPAGSSKTFAITPGEGNKVRDVVVDGESVGALGSYTFDDVREDHTISVTFTRGNAPADPGDTGVDEWFDVVNHNEYLHGYDNGTNSFGPDDNMTRAQAAAMFYNMMRDKGHGTAVVLFQDVPEGAWYSEAVFTLASHGLVVGTSPTTFEPDRPITRAEFTAIAMRFSNGNVSGENIFTDVFEGDWYYEVIVGSIKYGWISGYVDGTGRFGPNDCLTRGQATAIANRMLGRVPDGVFIGEHLDELRLFSDVDREHYAFHDIVEATNPHEYTKDGGFEHWGGLK